MSALLALGTVPDVTTLLRSTPERVKLASPPIDYALMLQAWNHGRGSPACIDVALAMADEDCARSKPIVGVVPKEKEAAHERS